MNSLPSIKNFIKSLISFSRLRRWIRVRKALNTFKVRMLAGIKTYDYIFVLILAATIGIMGGIIAVAFQSLIRFFQNGLWDSDNLIAAFIAAPLYLKLGIPAIGAAGVAWFVHRFASEAKGHGVPEVMNAIATHNGFIRMRVALVKAVASAMTIATGGSVGREGPIVQIGSAFGSTVGQLFQVSRRRMKTFVGCGAAAGIAATFNAPIAGALFASEIILGDFSTAAISPLMVSSVMATVVSHSLIGDYSAFTPPVYSLNNPVELIFYVILGIAAGFTGLAFIKTLYLTEDLFDRFNVHVAVKAALGGLTLGAIAIYVPQILGVGYGSVDTALSGDLPLKLAVIFLMAKLLATSLTLGYGGSGGVFAPSLFMGSMLGSALGSVFKMAFPQLGISPGAYALVGMAAVVSATTYAPITAILIIFEMTMEYTVILPLMIASILGMVITQQLSRGSIYTLKLKRKGINLHGGKDTNILNLIKIKDIKQTLFESVPESTPAEEILQIMSSGSIQGLYIVNQDNQLVGTLSLGSVRRFLSTHHEIPSTSTAKDLANTQYISVTDFTSVGEALKIMSELDVQTLAVVDDRNQITGLIHKSDILREYQELLLKRESTNILGFAMKYVNHPHHEKIDVMEGFQMARIDVPSAFISRTVAMVNVRKKHNIEVLLIRRETAHGWKEIIPDDKIKMQAGDQLLIFGREDRVNKLCSLA